MRIYDQPDHPAYGPVRRVHIMILQFFADKKMDRIDLHYHEHYNSTWDEDLARLMQWDPQEALNSRCILERVLTLPTLSE